MYVKGKLIKFWRNSQPTQHPVEPKVRSWWRHIMGWLITFCVWREGTSRGQFRDYGLSLPKILNKLRPIPQLTWPTPSYSKTNFDEAAYISSKGRAYEWYFSVLSSVFVKEGTIFDVSDRYSWTLISARIRWMNVVTLTEIVLIELHYLWIKIIRCIRELTLRDIMKKKII